MAKRGRKPHRDRGFRYVAADLRQRLLGGEWEPGADFLSLRDVAAHYDVGMKAARLATEELRRAGMLFFDRRHRLVVPSTGEQWVPTPNPVLLALWWRLSQMMDRGFSKSLLKGVFQRAEEGHHELLIAQDPATKHQLPVNLLDRPLHGALLLGEFRRHVISRFEPLECPVVLVDTPLPVSGIHKICVDNIRSACDATLRLIDEGHQHIAFAYVPNADATERRMGFLKALYQRGLPTDRKAYVRRTTNRARTQAMLRGLFLREPRHTAVLAAGEQDAIWVTKELAGMDLEVPADVSIVCFQSRRSGQAKFTGPSIDFAEMGRQAFAMLAGPKNPTRLVRIPTVWEEGKTLAPPRR